MTVVSSRMPFSQVRESRGHGAANMVANSYSFLFLGDDVDAKFTIIPLTGLIQTTSSPLDRETRDSYTLTVIAMDSGTPPNTVSSSSTQHTMFPHYVPLPPHTLHYHISLPPPRTSHYHLPTPTPQFHREQQWLGYNCQTAMMRPPSSLTPHSYSPWRSRQTASCSSQTCRPVIGTKGPMPMPCFSSPMAMMGMSSHSTPALYVSLWHTHLHSNAWTRNTQHILQC